MHSAAVAPGTLGGYLRERAENPDDPTRPALVVQGGGLRGIYSLSALAVLEELGLRDAFSRVIGSSAGAINGAYFLAGQAAESLSIYTEDLSNKDFVDPWRFRKIVDVDYMIEVLKTKHHLDERTMREAPATLYTVLTDAKTAEHHVVSSRDPRLDVYKVFQATAALPGLYNEKIQIDPGDEKRYVDGGVSQLVPLDLALGDLSQGFAEEEAHPGDAVVLLTRAKGHQKRKQNFLVRGVVHALWWRQSRSVWQRVCRGDDHYNEVMEGLEREKEITPRRTWTLFPSDMDRLVNRTTTDRDELLRCAEMAREDTYELLAERHAALAFA